MFYSTLRELIDAFVTIFLLQLGKQKSCPKMYLEHIFGTHLLFQILKFSDVCSMSIFNKLMDGSVTVLEYACNRFLLSYNYNYNIDLFAVFGVDEQDQRS